MSNTFTIYFENLDSILFDNQSLSIWGDGDNVIVATHSGVFSVSK